MVLVLVVASQRHPGRKLLLQCIVRVILTPPLIEHFGEWSNRCIIICTFLAELEVVLASLLPPVKMRYAQLDCESAAVKQGEFKAAGGGRLREID